MSQCIYDNESLQNLLVNEIDHMVDEVEAIAKTASVEQLNKRPAANAWSANECFHHLNLTYQAYMPSIHRGIRKFKGSPSKTYRSGLVGDRMIRTMAPSKGAVPEKKKTRTFKKINPDHQVKFIGDPIDTFLVHLKEFKTIVDRIDELNLGQIRVNSLVGNIIKFKLGDAIQIVHVHNQRHIIQAKNAVKSNDA